MLDRWRLKDFDSGEGLAQGAHRGEAGEGWIDIRAPGDTYLALIEAGRIPHPFKAQHEGDVAWVRDREWWWRTEVDPLPVPAPGETIELVFEGLDTFAEIYLDGVSIGRTDNMFRTYAFDVSAPAKVGGKHQLAICFTPTGKVAVPVDLPVWTAVTDRVSVSRRNSIRKAQYGWGWDWGPNLPTVGVWMPARIERRGAASIRGVNFSTLAISEGSATARIDVEVVGTAGPSSRLEIELIAAGGQSVLTRSIDAAETATVDVAIPEPQLWWTADLGEQPLYTLRVDLVVNGVSIDQLDRRVGVRTLALDTSDDPHDPGASFFRFILNGVPLFSKGTNWIPASSFVAEVESERYRDLLEAMVAGNMNMVRIWGGGVYEPDLFYDLCDDLGLLVWQDFMFACAQYPEKDPAFVDSVRLEIEDQVRRLRGHACLALWCGNNENQVIHDLNANFGGDAGPLGGTLYYDKMMPELIDRLDPATPYWPSSPWGGPSPNSMRAGDVHNWTVWHGVPLVPEKEWIGRPDPSPTGLAFTRYAEDFCRFVSEFGIQAAPEATTLKRWMDAADLSPHSPGFLLRVKDVPDKAHAMMLPETGVPETFQDYVDFSMWTQAVGLAFGIEHYRRRTPACSGALIWQMNDCWPCISWSLIDFDGVRKASYFAVRRAFAPVLASFRKREDGRFEAWITNDTTGSLSGIAVIALEQLDGEVLWRREIDFEVGATTSAPVWTGDVEAAPDRFLTIGSPDGQFDLNRKLLAPIAKIPLAPGARPGVTVERLDADTLEVTLKADAFLAFVHLTTEQVGLRFSDNYFDLAAGETRTVTVRRPGGLAADAFEVRCWNSTHTAANS